jgi:hypothetical protein
VLKTAIIKQVYDVFGPWSGFLWKDTTPQKILQVWPLKAVYWELTCILEADWYIIPPITVGDYVRDIVRHPGHANLLEKYTTNVTPIDEIPFGDYDLVITVDPLPIPSKNSRTLFAYYAQEHWDRIYRESMEGPYPGYDLFLDHMLDAPQNLGHLPQALAFPYIHDPRFLRAQFSPPRQEVVWADHRILMTLAGRKPGELAPASAAAAKIRLEKILGVEIRCRTINHTAPWGVYDPPRWDDTAHYFRELAECKYYLAAGDMAGAGQGLAEAAAAGCLCIGQTDRAYHRILCHPFCLCEDIAELPVKFRQLAGSPDLQREVLSWQDKFLVERFLERPLAAFADAVQMKRGA